MSGLSATFTTLPSSGLHRFVVDADLRTCRFETLPTATPVVSVRCTEPCSDLEPLTVMCSFPAASGP